MNFKPIKNNKVYEQVIEQIKELIYQGKIKRGDKLPSERTLRQQLKVSRASIREAFSALEMIGLIDSRPGEGTFIKKHPAKNLLEPLSLNLLLEENVAEELVELRRVLEVDCVRLAVGRVTEEELAEMDQHIIDLSNSSGFEEKSITADKLFHYTIAKASKNKVLYFTMIAISEAMDFHIKNTRTRLVSNKATMDEFVRQHCRIFKAIKEQSVEKAMSEMQDHLNYVEKLIKRESTG